jgi:hypothetical protein
MTNLFTHIDKYLLKWIWFNTNRRYKWHCCLLLFLAWLITESVYNDAFRTFSFSMQQCIVYMTKTIRIILINFRFQIGNDRQSKRLLSYFQVLFFSLTIKDKTNISLTIKILHLEQGSFTRKVSTIFTLKIIVSIFVKLFLILVLHLRQFFIARIFVKRATGH